MEGAQGGDPWSIANLTLEMRLLVDQVGSCLNADSHSLGLWWGLRVCPAMVQVPTSSSVRAPSGKA